MSLIDELKKASATRILSATKLIEEVGTEVTVCGFAYVTSKKGKVQPVFKVREGRGLSFYATNWQIANLLPIFERQFKTSEAIDAQLQAHPQEWYMEVVETKTGNPFVLTEIVGELANDGESGIETAVAGGNGASSTEAEESDKCSRKSQGRGEALQSASVHGQEQEPHG